MLKKLTFFGFWILKMPLQKRLNLHSAAFLGINFLIDAAHAINDNTVPLLYI